MKLRKYFVIFGSVVFAVLAVFMYRLHSVDPNIVTVEGLSNERFQQESQRIVELLESQGVQASFTYIRDKSTQDSAFAKDCHPLLHHLGNAALSYFGSFQTAMEHADEQCNSGYVHGLIEANFKAAESIDEALATSCTDYQNEAFKQWQCFHGLGHGVMQTNDKDHIRSLESCRKLQTKFANSACTNGVFMEEFIVIDHSGNHTAGTSVSGLTTCDTQEESVKADCYSYAPTAYLQQRTGKFHDAIGWCEMNGKDYVNFCYSGVGSQLMKDNITDPAVSAKFCGSLKRSARVACANGAVSMFVSYNAETGPAQRLCREEFRNFADTCNQAIDTLRQTLKI